jgi:hypothetical protein
MIDHPHSLSDRWLWPPLQIGSTGESFEMIFDTGSSDVWVPSSICRECGDKPKYDHDASTTYKEVRASPHKDHLCSLADESLVEAQSLTTCGDWGA